MLRDGFKVYAGGCVASLTLSSSEWNEVLNGTNNFNVQEYSKRFSNAFRDSFDFLIYVLDTSEPPATVNGLYGQYIGLNTRLPVRTRRQLGSIVLTFIGSPSGSSNPLQGGPFLHEAMHEWGNYGVIPYNETPTNDIGSHWGFSSVGGQLGGYYGPTGLQNAGTNAWKAMGPPPTCLSSATADEIATWCTPRNTFNTFVNGGNSVEFGPLERYIAGFMPLSSLPSITYARNAAWLDPQNGIFSASSLVTLTPSDIVNRLGSRVPNYSTSQKDFRVAVIVLTPDNVLATSKLQDLNSTLTEFSRDGTPRWGSPTPNVIWNHNFYTATRGVASMRAGNLQDEFR